MSLFPKKVEYPFKISHCFLVSNSAFCIVICIKIKSNMNKFHRHFKFS